MKEPEIEEIFQNSLAVAFYSAFENEPPVVSLVFKSPNEGEKPYNFLNATLTKDEICLVVMPVSEDKLNLTFIDKKNNQVYNVTSIIYQRPNFEEFQANYTDKYTVFLTMFLSGGELVVSSECQSPIIINEILFIKLRSNAL